MDLGRRRTSFWWWWWKRKRKPENYVDGSLRSFYPVEYKFIPGWAINQHVWCQSQIQHLSFNLWYMFNTKKSCNQIIHVAFCLNILWSHACPSHTDARFTSQLFLWLFCLSFHIDARFTTQSFLWFFYLSHSVFCIRLFKAAHTLLHFNLQSINLNDPGKK